MKKIIKISFLMMLVMLFISCSKYRLLYEPYEIGKVTAETILFKSRIAQNKGLITEDQFNQIRKIYDDLYVLQNQAIDLTIAYVKYNKQSDKEKLDALMNEIEKLSLKLLELSLKYGIK